MPVSLPVPAGTGSSPRALYLHTSSGPFRAGMSVSKWPHAASGGRRRRSSARAGSKAPHHAAEHGGHPQGQERWTLYLTRLASLSSTSTSSSASSASASETETASTPTSASGTAPGTPILSSATVPADALDMEEFDYQQETAAAAGGDLTRDSITAGRDHSFRPSLALLDVEQDHAKRPRHLSHSWPGPNSTDESLATENAALNRPSRFGARALSR